MKRKIFLGIGSGFLATILLTSGAGAQAKNLSDIAILKFYPAAQGNSFPVGISPNSVVFDGSSIWVGNGPSNSIMKLRGSDGARVWTITTSDAATGMAFDGANIWIANPHQHSVTKLRARDGVKLGSFGVGLSPVAA